MRTRLYFTSASHLYSLLNVIKFGLNIQSQHDRISKTKSVPSLDDLTLRMDFLSGIYFRVFENLIVDEDDPARFKLEIMLNHGAILNHDELDKIGDSHTIHINIDKVYKQTLTLQDIDSFFSTLLDMQEIGEAAQQEDIAKPPSTKAKANVPASSAEEMKESEKVEKVESKKAAKVSTEKDAGRVQSLDDNYMNEEELIKNLKINRTTANANF